MSAQDQTLPELKPGIFTSEFITTIVTQLVGLLVLSGHVNSADAPVLVQYITYIVTGFMMVATAVSYIWSRYGLKKALIEKSQPINITYNPSQTLPVVNPPQS